jgi:hypothetical protein
VKNICDALSSIEGIDKVSRISHEWKNNSY